MGAFLGNGRGKPGLRRSYRPMSEINVTPMVDVMLVLLVIFMVTAPLLTAGVDIDLPKTKAKAMRGDDQPLVVQIRSDGSIRLQETPVQLDELVPRLQAITQAKPDTRIFIKGDRSIGYGRILEVMAELQVAGYGKLGLVSDPKADGRREGR